jgi:hypothetical protein
MADDNNRQAEFKNKLFALLREYDVTMEVEVSYRNWETSVDGIHFSGGHISHDEKTWEMHQEIDFNVGNYENGKS